MTTRVPHIVNVWAWLDNAILKVEAEASIFDGPEVELYDRVKGKLMDGIGDPEGRYIVVDYELRSANEQAHEKMEQSFFEVYHRLSVANLPTSGVWSRGDAIVPRIRGKYREGSRLWVLFDTGYLGRLYNEDDVLPVHDIPKEASHQSIWTYIAQLWRAGMYSEAHRGANNFVLLRTRDEPRSGSSLPPYTHVLMLDYFSLREWPPSLAHTLRDETLVVQNAVDEDNIGYAEAISRLAMVHKKSGLKHNRLESRLLHNLKVLGHYLPYTPEERASEPEVQEWMQKLMTADRSEVARLLRDRRMLELLQRVAPKVTDLVAVGNYSRAEQVIRQMSARENELRLHDEIADVTDDIMEAFIGGDTDQALDALRDRKKKRLLNEAIPGLQSALERGDEEAIRRQILDYRKRHKDLDEELNRDETTGDLLQRFSKARFGKSLRDGLLKLTGRDRRRGGGGTERGGRERGEGSGSSEDWVVFRWFDFSKPDRQWVRREH